MDDRENKEDKEDSDDPTHLRRALAKYVNKAC